jgi:hypothetical protein
MAQEGVYKLYCLSSQSNALPSYASLDTFKILGGNGKYELLRTEYEFVIEMI